MHEMKTPPVVVAGGVAPVMKRAELTALQICVRGVLKDLDAARRDLPRNNLEEQIRKAGEGFATFVSTGHTKVLNGAMNALRSAARAEQRNGNAWAVRTCQGILGRIEAAAGVAPTAAPTAATAAGSGGASGTPRR